MQFIDRVTRELLQTVVQAEVLYYGISLAETPVDDLYDEAPRKVWMAPVRCNALVAYDNPNTLTTNLGVDSRYTLEVYFHQAELDDRNLLPREGDFVEYGAQYWEITSVARPQVAFGQIQKKVMRKCTCVPAREGQFAAGGSREESVDNTTAVVDAPTVTLG